MKLRVSSSVSIFKPKVEKVWGIKEWDGIDDPDQDLIFFGLYHDRDYEVFQNFKGNRFVFWCGGDILRLADDYERRRVLKICPATHYCETEKEAELLKKIGIDSQIVPSFLGLIKDYPISFTPPADGKWKVWMCGHPHREKEYGFDQARELAKVFPDVEFHLYGLTDDYDGRIRAEFLQNIIYHGQVPEKQLDEEIKNYHCGFRPNENDGVSEVIIKSILLGQFPISRLPYEGVWQYNSFQELTELINKLKQQTQPNTIRELWTKKINNFPWCRKEKQCKEQTY